MSDYRIVEVQSKRDLRKFVKFPDKLYRNCPYYVPALHSDQIHSLTDVSTAKYCPHKMWMVLRGKTIVGRICAMINPRYNELYKVRRVRFGWFDTINDIEVARLLITTAEAWAGSQGMTEIHGPLYYNTLGKQGMVVEGFDKLPPFNCYYNYSYYPQLIEQLGFVKECDWIQYRMDCQQIPPEKLYRVAGRLMERHKLKEGRVQDFIKDPNLVKKFFHMYSDAFTGNVHNFIPFTEEEIEEEAKSTMSFLKNELCCIIVDEDNEVAAFGIGFPTMSRAFQKAHGRLFPLGWIHILRAMHNISHIDLMLLGAAPKWQNTGISSIFHITMGKQFRENGVYWAITNPQIEDNQAVFVWEKYDQNERYIRRRCYIKPID
ncbi:MAG: hypothetical protein LUC24_06150 [Bacteroidales bacterium]|nr:hypothetical protein [Bacteroidales bacterium]